MIAAEGRTCPYCGAAAPDAICGGCRRDTTAARRPCQNCGKVMPSADADCPHCGARFRNPLRWKIPVIVLMFLLAFALSIALATA